MRPSRKFLSHATAVALSFGIAACAAWRPGISAQQASRERSAVAELESGGRISPQLANLLRSRITDAAESRLDVWVLVQMALSIAGAIYGTNVVRGPRKPLAAESAKQMQQLEPDDWAAVVSLVHEWKESRTPPPRFEPPPDPPLPT